MTITSPKTEQHEGRESRQCPLFPRVRGELERLRAEASADAVYVLDSVRDKWITKRGWRAINLRTGLERAIRKAGYKPWPKLFNSLRGSCETELSKEHPIECVVSWLGNSPKIALKNYLHVRPEDFEKAAKAETTQIPTQHLPARDRSQPQPIAGNSGIGEPVRAGADKAGRMQGKNVVPV